MRRILSSVAACLRSLLTTSSTDFEGPTGKPVAWGAFKRASTYSMGSIAFGSLIVAILDLLRAALQVLQQYAASEGSAIGTAIACCAQCCVGCVASLVEYFNRYASRLSSLACQQREANVPPQ